MESREKLYRMICDAVGKEELSDAEIHKIVLFLQHGLCQSSDTYHFGVGELVHVDADGD